MAGDTVFAIVEEGSTVEGAGVARFLSLKHVKESDVIRRAVAAELEAARDAAAAIARGDDLRSLLDIFPSAYSHVTSGGVGFLRVVAQ